MSNKASIETTTCNHFIENEILYIVFKEGVDVCIDAMKESKKARLELQKGKSMRVLVDSRGMFNVTKEARAYAAEDRHTKLSLAMAIVSDSLSTRILINFFIKFNRPNTPTKIFTNEEKALNWLKLF